MLGVSANCLYFCDSTENKIINQSFLKPFISYMKKILHQIVNSLYGSACVGHLLRRRRRNMEL